MWFKKETKKITMWCSPNPSLGDFELDYVETSTILEIMKVRIQRGTNVEFYHYLTRVNIRFILISIKKLPLRIKNI